MVVSRRYGKVKVKVEGVRGGGGGWEGMAVGEVSEVELDR